MMTDYTQAMVNLICDHALEKIMGDKSDESRDHALKLIARRLERHGWEAGIDVWELCEETRTVLTLRAP